MPVEKSMNTHDIGKLSSSDIEAFNDALMNLLNITRTTADVYQKIDRLCHMDDREKFTDAIKELEECSARKQEWIDSFIKQMLSKGINAATDNVRNLIHQLSETSDTARLIRTEIEKERNNIVITNDSVKEKLSQFQKSITKHFPNIQVTAL